jgi:hypothetical protein
VVRAKVCLTMSVCSNGGVVTNYDADDIEIEIDGASRAAQGSGVPVENIKVC